MKKVPDFYLSSARESPAFVPPRACRIAGRLRSRSCNELMLVAVDPPVVGQPYGMGGEDIASVILSPRFEGSSLFPVTEWPCHVYVARILNESVTRTLFVGPDDVEMMAWATIYRVQEEAEAHCITTR